MKKFIVSAILVSLLGSAFAAGVAYKDGDKYVKFGGRIQLQYHMTDPDDGESSDELRFRRLRPYVEGSIVEDWKGKFQFDFGKSDVAVKDAYFVYSGYEYAKLLIGNANFAFSREKLSSSKKQQLVERTFVGDHNYGTPDRQAGLHLSGDLLGEMLTWNAGVAKAAIDPDNTKLDFDTVIQFDKGSDWVEGNMYGGRLEFFPIKYFKPEQGDFDRDMRFALGLGAFAWDNDDDNKNIVTDEESGASYRSHKDVDSVTGIEFSAAFRGAGFSIDAQYNIFESELVNGKSGADGIYKDGDTTLENYAIEGGYMIIPSKVELVAGYQGQDADGYDSSWKRTSVGANYFVDKHLIKYQLAYRMGENKDGVGGKDVDELFVQAQYVF
jgi:phosphate-selective porin OprO and OprP